jgi:hypothetical protein
MSETSAAPAPRARQCQLPKCGKRLAELNRGDYCYAHSGETIEEYEKSQRKKSPKVASIDSCSTTIPPQRLIDLGCEILGVERSIVMTSLKGKGACREAQAKRIMSCLLSVDLGFNNMEIAALLKLKTPSQISTTIRIAKEEITSDPAIREKVNKIRSYYKTPG